MMRITAPLKALFVSLTLLLGQTAAAQADEPRLDAASGAAASGPSTISTGGFGAPAPPPGQFGARTSSGFSGEVGGGAMFEKIDEDYFVTLDLYNNMTIGPVTFGLWVPLRLRVWDKDPEDDGVIRQEDWDEVSDYARLLRFVEVNLGGDSWRFRARFGALEGESLGHGTVIAGYYNSLDRDHYQAGVVLDAAIKYGGVQFMLDNLLGPELFGLRLHVRPASFFTDNTWANKLVVGLSYSADTNAPVSISGKPVAFLPYTVTPLVQAMVDGQNNFVVTSSTSVPVVGLDFEYALIQNKLFDLVPYMDINFLIDQGTGVGFHLGTFFNVRIPTPVGPTLMTRLEYRAMSHGYAPRYFDSLYEIQRLQYAPGTLSSSLGLPLTKLGWLRTSDSGPNGWLGELYFDFAGWVRVGGTYEDYDGPDNASLTLSLLLPKLSIVKAGATYMRRGFDSLAGAFDLDGALLNAWVKFRAYGPLYLTASYTRTWHVQEDGTYLAEGDFNAGISLAFTY